jgi:hypothetical protein
LALAVRAVRWTLKARKAYPDRVEGVGERGWEWTRR